MERISEKVKDIVEVRSFTPVDDFTTDLRRTVDSYHFTDITADLMAKWIDAVTRIGPGSGEALALAGFRGVGKSHFLSVLSALLTRPELRERVQDPHVLRATEALPRRAFTALFVRRGSGSTLISEFRDEMSGVLGIPINSLPDTPDDLLSVAAARSDNDLVLFFDTFAERKARVRRNDGEVLSHIAAAAKKLGMFMGVALDDDISGADGRNSSISAAFRIDYLDQEHLYKIVDANVFVKKNQSLPVLRKIYSGYREGMPGFGWSENRFSSLYPLHPAILELAPVIRLYVHDFALLGFASDAGVKILGRPANSLIGLDEVFDSVEPRLRETPDLAGLFSVYDSIESRVIAKAPVGVRHQSKLVLKGLFLLSLDGQGAVPATIASSMMIIDDRRSTERNSMDVTSILESFAAFLPDGVARTELSNGSVKYRLLNDDGDEQASDIGPDELSAVTEAEVRQVLIGRFAAHFTDIDHGEGSGNSIPVEVLWRNGFRRGIVSLNSEAIEHREPAVDFKVVVSWEDPLAAAAEDAFVWRPGPLTTEDRTCLQRLYVLQHNETVKNSIGEELSKRVELEMLAADKIWNRVFFEEAAISGATQALPLSVASPSGTLSALIGTALDPLFAELYPDHPQFETALGFRQMSLLVTDFFAGADEANAEIEALAAQLAVPLGLAVHVEGRIIPRISDDIQTRVLSLVGGKPEEVIPIHTAAKPFQQPPLGLPREAVRLVLAALVSQRELDFVTASGNRISARSLGLQLLWDDIHGVTLPSATDLSESELVRWAALLTGDTTLRSLLTKADLDSATHRLFEWLEKWNDADLPRRFAKLADRHLNTAIWRTETITKKMFGRTAESICRLQDGTIDLIGCLKEIAGVFSHTSREFESAENEMQHLRSYIEWAELADTIEPYLYRSEITSEVVVERSRSSLLALLEATPGSFDRMVLDTSFEEFRAEYSAHYLDSHTKWYSAVSGVRCDVTEMMPGSPLCVCGFRLNNDDRTSDLLPAADKSGKWGIELLLSGLGHQDG